MMDHMMKMKMKIKHLKDLMDENDSLEGEKLKPKAAMAVEVTKIMPKHMHEDKMAGMSAMPGKQKDEELSDDDMKMLMKHYMGA